MSYYNGYLVNSIRNLQDQNIERDYKKGKKSNFFKDTKNRVDSIIASVNTPSKTQQIYIIKVLNLHLVV